MLAEKMGKKVVGRGRKTKICSVKGCNTRTFNRDCWCRKHRNRYTLYRNTDLNNKYFGYDDDSIKRYFSIIYYTQGDSSKKRNHKKPEYTFVELLKWVKSRKNFKKIYRNWIRSGHKSYLRPSIDRIDSGMGYSFDNIRLVTLRENISAGNTEKKGEFGNSHSIPVIMKDEKGKILARFCSGRFAAFLLGIKHQSIQCSIKTKRKAKGYRWDKDNTMYLNEACSQEKLTKLLRHFFGVENDVVKDYCHFNLKTLADAIRRHLRMDEQDEK